MLPVDAKVWNKIIDGKATTVVVAYVDDKKLFDIIIPTAIDPEKVKPWAHMFTRLIADEIKEPVSVSARSVEDELRSMLNAITRKQP